jgi:hypothetical protein
MQSKYSETAARSFSPMPLPALAPKAREAVNAALEDMLNWRNETVEAANRNGKKVLEKMADAARALGWPEQVVDAVRSQIQAATELQTKTMDQIVDVWEEQLKSGNPLAASAAPMLEKLGSLPGFGQPGSWPDLKSFQALNPLQFWLQAFQHWQKSWEEAAAAFTKNTKL